MSKDFDANIETLNVFEVFKPFMEKKHGSTERFSELTRIFPQNKEQTYIGAKHEIQALIRYFDFTPEMSAVILMTDSAIIEGKEEEAKALRDPIIGLILSTIKYE